MAAACSCKACRSAGCGSHWFVLISLSNTICEALLSLSRMAKIPESAQIIFQITVGCVHRAGNSEIVESNQNTSKRV
jgi:hypothetical protein